MPVLLTVHWVNQYAIPPDQPGGSRHFELARELVRRGHSVEVVAADLNLTTRQYFRRRGARDVRRRREAVDGVAFTWLTAGSYAGNNWKRLVSMVVFGAATFAHLLTVRRSPRTVFIGSSPQLFAALGAWMAARVRRVPFVLEVRDLWPESYTEVSGRERGPEITAMRWVSDLLYRQAERIIVLAAPNIDRIVERGVDRSRLVCVPNGVDIEGFVAGAPGHDLREDGTFTFVYAGAHGPANDLATVVRACSTLAMRGRGDIRAVLIGDGSEKATLQALAAELGVKNLLFLDPVPKAQIGATLQTADAGLMVLAAVDLFSYGVSPNKLFDYLAVGLPVLTNVPGLVTDIVHAADAGSTVAGGDPDALADGMIALADDPPVGVDERGPAYIRANFDRRVLVSTIEEVLSEVVARR